MKNQEGGKQNKMKILKRSLILTLLIILMFPLISRNFKFSYVVNAVESSIVVDKYVSPVEDSSNEFLLTLEAYINGDSSNIEINKVDKKEN